MLDLDRLGNVVVLYAVDIAGALVTAIIGWWLAGVVERAVRRALLHSHSVDMTIAGFLSSLVRYALLVVAFVVVLQLIGIQATSLIAVLGAASLAIGLALQGTLSNMAAGVMLILFRPFRIGESIEVAGRTGTVRDLNLFMTELAGGDNVQVLIPNAQVWGAPLTNFSKYPDRRVSATVPVPLDRDVERIAEAARRFLADDPRVQHEPAPSTSINAVTDKAVELSVQAWSSTADAGAVRADLMRKLHELVRQPDRPERLAKAG